MPRPLRIEYKGARYHVMCRGNRGSVVFASDDDVRLFLKTLGEAATRANLRVHAFVLMGTHYHLLLETPSGTLVEGMKWLQGAFTQRMNAMHRTCGHLFQGRYKAKIIDSEDPDYFLKVSEYIHLNPAEAGLLGGREAGNLRDYAWSSFPFYLVHPGRRPEWLDAGAVLGRYGLRDTPAGRRRYAEQMEQRARRAATEPGEHRAEYKGMERGWVHGSSAFRCRMAALVGDRACDSSRIYDASQKRDLSEQAVGRFLSWGCACLKLDQSRLKELRKGDERKVLLAACIKARYSLSNRRIAELLYMGHPTFISTCQGRVEASHNLTRVYKELAHGMDHEKY
jgi:putative transposase